MKTANHIKGTIALQPTNLEQLRARLEEEHDGLSRKLKQVGDFIEANPQSVALDTAAVVATKAGVYASTLVRFANHFEFSGFTELQKLFKEDLHQNYTDYGARIREAKQSSDDDDSPSPSALLNEFSEANIQSLQTLQNQIDPTLLNDALNILESANSIHVCGTQRSFPVSMYFVYALNHMKLKCRAITGLGMMHEEEANSISASDALIAITFKPYSDITQSVIRTAHANGAKVILITGDEVGPLSEFANIEFNVKDAQVRSFRSLTSSMCLAQTLCIALGYRFEKNLTNSTEHTV